MNYEYKEEFIQGNHSKGRTIKPKGIVLHHINYGLEDVIKLFTQSSGILSNGKTFIGVSADVYIRKNGDRYRFGKDNQRLWHSGKSEFKGLKSCNNFMLGVEFEGDTNKEPLTNNQLTSFQEWLIPRIIEHNIEKDWITTHMRVSPGRKTDISEKEFSRIKHILNVLYNGFT